MDVHVLHGLTLPINSSISVLLFPMQHLNSLGVSLHPFLAKVNSSSIILTFEKSVSDLFTARYGSQV